MNPALTIAKKEYSLALRSLGTYIILGGFLLAAGIWFALTALKLGVADMRDILARMHSFFLFFIPAIMLSGFIFPIENMPQVVQWITLANPLRYYLVVIRGVFLKGVGLDVLWPQLAGLLALGFFTMTVATRRFKKTMA